MSETSPPLLLEADALEAMLGQPELLLVDVCQPTNWQQLHLPGAVHFNPAELLLGTPPAPGKLPELSTLETMFARIGYSPDKHIVVYDDEGGGWAGRFIWILDAIGHRHYSYLNGGLFAWYKDKRPLTSTIDDVAVTEVCLHINHTCTATMEEVMQSLDDAGSCIWDARSAEEYAGLKSSSAKAGHIPGAKHLDWLELMDRNDNLRLLPAAALKQKIAAAGISEHVEIITHCQSHHRSGLSYLVAKLLGYQVRAYAGSWAEWGNNPDTPIETR